MKKIICLLLVSLFLFGCNLQKNIVEVKFNFDEEYTNFYINDVPIWTTDSEVVINLEANKSYQLKTYYEKRNIKAIKTEHMIPTKQKRQIYNINLKDLIFYMD